MHTQTRRWVFVSLLLFCLALPFVFAMTIEVLPKPDAAARQWYKSLSVADIASAESAIQSLSHSRTQAVFSHLTPAKQARFWQDRLGSYLNDHPGLTGPQRNAVDQARALLTEEFFSNRGAHAAANKSVLADIYRVFDRAEADQLTARVAPAGTIERIVATSSDWIKSQLTVLAGPNDHCDCIDESPIGCGSSLQCVSPPPDGCRALDECWAGWLTWYTCYGLCGVPF